MNYSRSQSLGSLIRVCGPRLTGPLRVLVAGPVAAGDACPRQSPFKLGETKSDAEALNQLCLRRRPKHRRERRHGRSAVPDQTATNMTLGLNGFMVATKKLSAYQAKRDFTLTGKPTGGAEPQVGPAPAFRGAKARGPGAVAQDAVWDSKVGAAPTLHAEKRTAGEKKPTPITRVKAKSATELSHFIEPQLCQSVDRPSNGCG
jgi:hypothetical protein